MAAKRSRPTAGRAAARKRAPRERLPVIEVDVDDEAALSAVAEQVVAAIFELTGATAAKPEKGTRRKARKGTKKAKAEKTRAPRSTAGRKRR